MKALLALLLPISAAAASSVTCITKTDKGYKEPLTLSVLVSCQKKKLAAKSAAYEKTNKFAAPDETLESWHDVQRAEVRDYLKRHPERAALDNPKDLPAETPYAEDAAHKSKALLHPASDAQKTKDIDDLGKKLQAESNGGKDGVTPEMAQQVDDYLQKNQGSISPDMQDLLNSVQKDGSKLTPETMSKLQDAAKQAKGDGLDLNVDQKTENLLLAPKEPNPNSN